MFDPSQTVKERQLNGALSHLSVLQARVINCFNIYYLKENAGKRTMKEILPQRQQRDKQIHL